MASWTEVKFKGTVEEAYRLHNTAGRFGKKLSSYECMSADTKTEWSFWFSEAKDAAKFETLVKKEYENRESIV